MERDHMGSAAVVAGWSSDLVGSRRNASSLLDCVLEESCQPIFFLRVSIDVNSANYSISFGYQPLEDSQLPGFLLLLSFEMQPQHCLVQHPR